MDGENTPPQLRHTGKSFHLPEEIIEEILSRLPVTSLLRFRCVSKSWRCLIGSNRFIKTQLKKLKEDQNFSHWRVIFKCDSINPKPGLKQCSVRSYKDDPSVEPSPFDDPINNHLMIGSRVVGHCNGLLCILNQSGYFFLWNPATRISVKLPKLDHRIKKFGFGRDEQTGAYKVFAVLYAMQKKWIGKVYSSKTNSWKTVKHGSLDFYDRAGEFACGKIHWPARRGHIETFDLESEVFGMIELPCKPEVGDSLWLVSQEGRGGCLTMVCDNTKNRTRTIWDMKQYGVKESWVKVCIGPIPSDYASMAWRIDKGLLKFPPCKKIVGCDQTCFYVESLVSPVPDKNL